MFHRVAGFLKLGILVFLLGSVVTLWVNAAHAQSEAGKPIGERVAVVEADGANAKTEIIALRLQVQTESDEIATMRGMGIGAVAVLGILDTVQLILLKRKAG